MDSVIWLDEACLGDEGRAQCGSCGRVRPVDRMVGVSTFGDEKRRWMCIDCEEKDEKEIKVKFLDERARLPRRAHRTDVGYDLFVSEETVCEPGEFTDIPCGIAICLPEGHWGHIVGRSSAIRTLGLMIVPAIIDQGYTGPLFTGCWNLRDEEVKIREGDRVAQLIVSEMILPGLEIVAELPQTDRGGKGFGSSGR
jgi:dUTP pyrophosphatase